jgi:hypothetical protein
MSICACCGHPDANAPQHGMPWPNPLNLWLGNPPLCMDCEKSVLSSDHVWTTQHEGLTLYLCCSCKGRRDRPQTPLSDTDKPQTP